MRRLVTLRGRGLGDILDGSLGPLDPSCHGVDLDEFYRRGLAQGLDLHQRQDRGLLPGGLVEEIRALSHPPLPWDARLARWFDEYVPRPEPVRTYARPARRQASTPGIPRAGRYFPPEEVSRCTFGVVLDTSGSMSRVLLGKALGAIASYAEARDVPAARVVFCDAAPHDAGYLPVTEIAMGAPPRPFGLWGGFGFGGAAARCSSPASTCSSARTTSRGPHRSSSSPTAGATCCGYGGNTPT